jgi:hypothetical protein
MPKYTVAVEVECHTQYIEIEVERPEGFDPATFELSMDEEQEILDQAEGDADWEITSTEIGDQVEE